MTNERQVRETIAQCVHIMMRYHDDARSPERRDMMVAEVQVMAGGVKEIGLSPAEAEVRILQPVGAALLARYGHEVGPRLHAEFLKAFDELHEMTPGTLAVTAARQDDPGPAHPPTMP